MTPDDPIPTTAELWTLLQEQRKKVEEQRTHSLQQQAKIEEQRGLQHGKPLEFDFEAFIPAS